MGSTTNRASREQTVSRLRREGSFLHIHLKGCVSVAFGERRMAVVLSFPWVYFFCSVGYTVFFLFVPPSLPENGGQGLALALRVFPPLPCLHILFFFPSYRASERIAWRWK